MYILYNFILPLNELCILYKLPNPELIKLFIIVITILVFLWFCILIFKYIKTYYLSQTNIFSTILYFLVVIVTPLIITFTLTSYVSSWSDLWNILYSIKSSINTIISEVPFLNFLKNFFNSDNGILIKISRYIVNKIFYYNEYSLYIYILIIFFLNILIGIFIILVIIPFTLIVTFLIFAILSVFFFFFSILFIIHFFIYPDVFTMV